MVVSCSGIAVSESRPDRGLRSGEQTKAETAVELEGRRTRIDGVVGKYLGLRQYQCLAGCLWAHPRGYALPRAPFLVSQALAPPSKFLACRSAGVPPFR